MDERELAEVIAGCRASHAALLATVEGLGDDAAGRPSRLPGWTVGHVLTHIARNADSHVRMLDGAGAGEVREQYLGGADGRRADIDAGASRTLAALVDDVRSSSAALEALWDQMEPPAWDGECIPMAGRRKRVWELPYMRWREVEVHHVDLGTGYDHDQWPEGFVTRELPLLVATLPARLSDAPTRAAVAAWLLDRGDLPAEIPLRGWQA